MYERVYCKEQIDELIKLDPHIKLIYVDMEDFAESHIVTMIQSLTPRFMSPSNIEYFLHKTPYLYLIKAPNV